MPILIASPRGQHSPKVWGGGGHGPRGPLATPLYVTPFFDTTVEPHENVWDGELGPTVEACMSRPLPDYKSAIILLPPSHKSKKMLPRKRDTSQSHTKGPFSGPALTIVSFNVEGLSAAKEQLIADLTTTPVFNKCRTF